MCLAVFEWSPQSDTVIKVVANRDEFRARPSQAMHWWPENILAGKDLEAGGSWLGFNHHGQFALLTNIRPGFVGFKGELSRGDLVKSFLSAAQSPAEFHQRILPDIHRYGGFNLLLGNKDSLRWLSSTTPTGKQLEPGIFGLSNDSLDTPWPKTELAKRQMQQQAEKFHHQLIVEGILDSQQQADIENLPKTGVPLEWEHKLSAQTILGEDYGTRCRTFFTLSKKGRFQVAEQQVDAQGKITDLRQFSF